METGMPLLKLLHFAALLDRLRAILEWWPLRLAQMGTIDLVERRNRLLRGLARQ